MNRRNFFSRLTGVTAALLAGVTLKRQQFPRPYDPEELARTPIQWRCNAEMRLNQILAENINRDIRNQMYARMLQTRLRS
jgi:hypothetical protein